jgi:hypothetical protein
MIELGSRVRDVYSGFEGVATARTVYLYGTSKIRVDPARVGDDGKILPEEWVDEPRLEVLKIEKAKIGFQGTPL